MIQPTLNIEDYPLHWKATLLGDVFWKDAEEYNQPINKRIEADHNRTLHTRFPFNLGREQTSQPQSPSVDYTSSGGGTSPRSNRRRFSMSDALGQDAVSAIRGRVREITGRGRSNSRSSSAVSDTHQRSISHIRVPSHLFHRGGSSGSRGRRMMGSPAVMHPLVDDGLHATPENPLMGFRGGAVWSCISRNRRELGLDTFWATDERPAPEGETILPIESLAPLCEFRNLRVLKLTGMVQSYQKYIWQAAWLNTELEELEVEMILPPRLRRGFMGKWPYIKGGWELRTAHYGEPVYYGQYGDGNLAPKIGVGEYLDKLAIEKAKVRAMAVGGRTRNRLTIRTLSLSGFVVDADPFLHWFDPTRLKCINFKNDCVDAGFYLSMPMKKVAILFPREVEQRLVIGRRVDLWSELKVVQLVGGRKVWEEKYGMHCYSG